ncbi:MAG: riboflavin synthase [Elusimicrobia bacterium]|nr:riboflavin synthase [Elusimicrobiota bacterium]
MFTGIVEAVGTVKKAAAGKLEITAPFDDVKRGDSVAADGICLTAVAAGNGQLTFDFSPRTAGLTTLPNLRAGDKINLERAALATTRLGGHIVLGHADGTAKISGMEKMNNFYKFTFIIKPELEKYFLPGASVTINGISLTVDKITGGNLSVVIIPETFTNTALRYKKTGDFVNIEADILAKYALNAGRKNITENFLREHGFL